MVKRSLGREFLLPRFIKHLCILGMLQGKFLFYFLHCLGKGSGKCELSDMGVVFSQNSVKSGSISLLDIDPRSIVQFVTLNGSQILQEILLFNHFWFIMLRDGRPYHVHFSSPPVDSWIVLHQPRVSQDHVISFPRFRM